MARFKTNGCCRTSTRSRRSRRSPTFVVALLLGCCYWVAHFSSTVFATVATTASAPLWLSDQRGLDGLASILGHPTAAAEPGATPQPENEIDAAQDDGRTITFAQREWIVKSGLHGPGENDWSDSEESVWIEGGQLHMKIRKIDGRWNSAEVYTRDCTQYGMHRFFIVGRLDQLDRNVVFAPFLYRDDDHEIDIEFSRWGQEAPEHNAQYVVQPVATPGNLEPFTITLNGDNSTHYIDWNASSIQFKSFHGHSQEPPTAGHLIHEWQYTGGNIPSEAGCVRTHINLWLFKANAPANQEEVEITIKDAQLPEPVPPQSSFYISTFHA